MPEFRKSTLRNGIRVVSENHPHSRSVTIGVWVDTGTRDEKEKEKGVSHFLEHLVFKGTKKRSSFQIAKSLEEVGGDLNAYTTREYTCYHGHTLREHLKLNIEVLADLVCNAEIDAKDLDKERSVVVQEILMTKDTPEEQIFDDYFEDLFPNDTIGWPILGTEKSIEEMSRKTIVDYYKGRYHNKNIVVSAAGSLSHDELVKYVEQCFRRPTKTFSKRKRVKPKYHSVKKWIDKDSEQVHIVMGLPSCSFQDKLRFESFVVNSLLGGGMTSRLYQSIRENRGLAYSVYSQLLSFTDCGVMTVYAGTDADNAKNVCEMVVKELIRLKKEGVKKSDLELFKTQVRGMLFMGADDIENRMTSIGVNELVFEGYRPIEDVIRDLDAVNLSSIHKFIDKYLDEKKLSMYLMGGVAQPWLKQW